MSKQVSPVVAVLALVVVLVAIGMVYTRRLQEPPPFTMRGPARGGIGRGARGGGGDTVRRDEQDARLGIESDLSTEPKGLRIVSFREPRSRSPLVAIGLKEGDIVLSCNEYDSGLRMRLVLAVTELQRQGQPVKLEVSRGGKQIAIEWTQKLPDDVFPMSPEGRPTRPDSGGRSP